MTRGGATRWATSRSSTRCTATASAAPSAGLIMGETAELLAREYGITREQSDGYALESQRRAESRRQAGRFAAGDRAGARHRPEGRDDDRGRRTSAARGTTLEALRRAAARVPGGRRPAGHHHGGLVVGHHRRRGGGARGEWRRRARTRAASARAHSRLGHRGRRPARAWASAPCPPSASCCDDCGSRSTISISSS